MNTRMETTSLSEANPIRSKGVYIPQIDGKDLWISNYAMGREYSVKRDDGKLNYKRFKASFDYSLDLIKIREIYNTVYRNRYFSEKSRGKEYSYRIINVTFDYSVKEFNRVGSNLYVKLGEDPKELVFRDCLAYKDGEVVGIKTDTEVDNPVKIEEKVKYFYCKNGKYFAKNNIKSVKNVAEIRKKLYIDGFFVDGIKYVRWKRSAGSARVGKCLFIDERLYDRIHKWESCGVNVKPGDKIDLAAYESYISLTSSSIVGTLEIKPENILVIDDFDSVFDDDVISITESGGILEAAQSRTTVSNSIFDGQSLIDKSLMGEYENKGMVLLRNRFFKSCCFNANVQQWFADNNITEVSQLNGFTLAKTISDVKLITTPSSIKYFKFGSLEEWFGLLETTFGVVKYEKPPHYFNGRMVQAHYQLINSIQLTRNEVDSLLEPTFNFMRLVKNEPAALRHWINFSIEDVDTITPLQSKTDIIYKMMSLSSEFCKTKLYYDFRSDFLKSFTKNLKCGHVLINGNYSTLCGNTIEMLKCAIGEFDGTSEFKHNTVYSTRFDWDKRLLGSRSPHITFSNVLITQNKHYENITKYLNPTREIVFINSINENILQKLAGCDFDSDTVMLTDNEVLIKAAQRNDKRFKVAVCNVGGATLPRRYTPEDMADLDIKTSKNLIGEIINVSQELNTRVWDMLADGVKISDVQDIYLDICKLSIMSGIEIDKAKREFVVDNAYELKEIRNKYKLVQEDGKQIKPNFFAHIAKRKGYYNPDKRAYIKHDTSMDYLQTSVNRFRASRHEQGEKLDFLPFSELINKSLYNKGSTNYRQISEIFDFIDNSQAAISAIYDSEFLSSVEKHSTANALRQDCIEYIGKIKINESTMITLLRAIEKEEHSRHRRLLFYTLFGYPSTSFYDVLLQSRDTVYTLEEDCNGNIDIYGVKFAKIG